MSNAIESQIKDRIHAFVSELDALLRKNTLDRLSVLLAGGAAQAARKKRAGRGSSDVEAASEALLAHVQANDGQGVSQIAAATGTRLDTAKKALGRLLASGQLKKSGQRRGTRYHAGPGHRGRARRKG